MNVVSVNAAAWDGPADLPEGWLIANAPRPLAGQRAWTGAFRHGTFYAAAPEPPEGLFGWEADDARLVQFVTNDDLRPLLQAKLDEYGTTLDECGLTEAELAFQMQLPWHEETSDAV